jgi:putative DNA methylase
LKRKLIEVALPLEAINRESAREKSIQHGHPATLHPWWARRPLAACRAVLFASLVDDPSSLPEEFPTEEAQDHERKRLFGIIEELVKWENSNNERVLEAAQKEILKSTDGHPPPVLDPFCGGGSIPLEAQRLGLEAHASDLNPVAVLITKALIEIPPRFANQPPVNPDAREKLTHSSNWKGAQGLADDVRYYGKWMRDEAERRIGHLYPKVKLDNGQEVTVIAWLWARTVRCPNPACNRMMPLLTSLALSTRKNEQVSLVPVITEREIQFVVRRGTAGESPKVGRGAKFRCLGCGNIAAEADVRTEFLAKRNSEQMVAIAVDTPGRRSYLTATDEQVNIAQSAAPHWTPSELMSTETPNLVSGRGYGICRWEEIFTRRQLVTLTTLTDLVGLVRDKVLVDATQIIGNYGIPLREGGKQASAYADGIATILGLCTSKAAVFHNMTARWRTGEDKSAPAFGRQALPMVWNFAEVNPFAGAGGDFEGIVDGASRALAGIRPTSAIVEQLDARSRREGGRRYVVCTDPPYYDNIGYADLSDFFYIWLRKALKDIQPSLFSTLLSPKDQELVAAAERHGGDGSLARDYFEEGFRDVFTQLTTVHDSAFPLTVFYAFRQTESDGDDDEAAITSTGWETMLAGLIGTGWQVGGTWPTRTEGATRMIARNTNALSSSIVLVCRQRIQSAQIATRREFIAALHHGLPATLRRLQRSAIAAVDLAQAAIGPGMEIFSGYSKVIEADGSPMRVRGALQLINQALDEVLSEQESEYDADTQWAVGWFSDYGMNEGQFGVAEVLSKAKNTSVEGMERAGVIKAPKGKVRLVARENLSEQWDPATDRRLTIWEVTQHLIQRLKSGGEQEAADLLRKVGGMGEIARDLAYRLYSICERKGWAEEALAYNSLVVAWPEISRLASEAKPAPAGAQMTLP